jgi:hypothetical protein
LSCFQNVDQTFMNGMSLEEHKSFMRLFILAAC